MANALVIRRNTQLAKAEKALSAAPYVRMSTDYQRYSTANQAATIAAYTASRGLTIVRTYADEGQSGLKIANRDALAELIKDAQSGNTEFGNILVYDVSRWGRFQDIDESAHYEFVCKKAGVKVAYCAELTATRLSQDMRRAVDEWAAGQDGVPRRSEAIWRLVELGLNQSPRGICKNPSRFGVPRL